MVLPVSDLGHSPNHQVVFIECLLCAKKVNGDSVSGG